MGRACGQAYCLFQLRTLSLVWVCLRRSFGWCYGVRIIGISPGVSHPDLRETPLARGGAWSGSRKKSCMFYLLPVKVLISQAHGNITENSQG